MHACMSAMHVAAIAAAVVARDVGDAATDDATVANAHANTDAADACYGADASA